MNYFPIMQGYSKTIVPSFSILSDSSAILKYESSNELGLREFAEKTRSASAVAEYYERMEN